MTKSDHLFQHFYGFHFKVDVTKTWRYEVALSWDIQPCTHSLSHLKSELLNTSTCYRQFCDPFQSDNQERVGMGVSHNIPLQYYYKSLLNMTVYVYVNMCVYVCIYVCMCMDVCMCICVYVCIQVCMWSIAGLSYCSVSQISSTWLGCG